MWFHTIPVWPTTSQPVLLKSAHKTPCVPFSLLARLIFGLGESVPLRIANRLIE